MKQETAIEIIKKYSGESVTDITEITNRGLVNQIYIASTPSKKYVIRIDQDEDSTDRFEKEKWCSEASNGVGVLTPQVYSTDMSDNNPYMIMEYIDGTDGDNSNKKEVIWKALGNYAKKIHSIPVKGYGEGMTLPGTFNDSWDRYLDYNIQSLTPKDKAIELGAITSSDSMKIKDIFESLRSNEIKMGLSHYDLSLKNTIITHNDVVYLIDWGSATVGPVPYLDFAEILDSSLQEDSKEFLIFLNSYGYSFEDYKRIKPNIAAINLLVHMDHLRWAIDRRPERINHFVKEVKMKLAVL